MSKDSILVIGDLMLDEWVETSFRKISLETHVPINSMMIKKIELGGAANAARVCKFISNTKVIVMGVVGDDEAGKSIKELLQRENLEDALFVDLKDRQHLSHVLVLRVCRSLELMMSVVMI